MEQKIGTVAGAVWEALSGNGGLTLPKLKKAVNCKTPLLDWAIGWLAREDKILIKPEGKSFLVQLKDAGN
jgi:hypothetical protein